MTMAPPPPQNARDDFENLLRQARSGSREALGRLLEPFFRVLRCRADRHVRAGLRPKGGGSDLVQETLLDALLGFARFRGRTPDELAAWLWRILSHNGYNFRRRYLQSSKRQTRRELPLDDARLVNLRAALIAPGASPGSEVTRREDTMALRRALERLPPQQRLIVYLHGYERRPFHEIGAVVGCSGEAARKIWTRALRLLAGELRADDGSPN